MAPDTGIGRVRLRRGVPVMGTVVSFDVPGSADGAVDEAVRWLHWVDRTFSTYRPDSAVCRLDSGEISLSECPPEVAFVLASCEAVAAASDGYFSVRAAGALESFRVREGMGDRAGRAAADRRWIHVALRERRGDVQCTGPCPRTEGLWRIGISDPLRRGELVSVVSGRDFAVATSGVAERGAHIIDPCTGLPPSGLLSGDDHRTEPGARRTLTRPPRSPWGMRGPGNGQKAWTGYAAFGITGPRLDVAYERIPRDVTHVSF